jgi:VWFA-related protein
LALIRKIRGGLKLAPLVLGVAVGCAWSQTQSQQPLPDAPSAKRTPQQLPAQPPINTAPLPPSESAPTSQDGSSSSQDDKAAKDSADSKDKPRQDKPGQDTSLRPKVSADDNPFPEPGSPGNPSTPPSSELPVATPGPAQPPGYQPPPPQAESQGQLYTLTKRVEFVTVPVTVKDDTGRLVGGLLPKDFTLLESGVKQDLKFFTSDPFAISAAIIFDQGMPDVAVRKLNQTFPALEGAFSIYDEVSIYTYSSAVRKLKDFGALGRGSTAAFSLLKSETGRNDGPPVMGGPLGSAPSVNGRSVGGGPTLINMPQQESHVLNDALLKAAVDLGRRERGRRKVIFIVSDGRESGSDAAYADVLHVLLTNEITVYAVAADDAAIPVVRKLKEIKIPRHGYGNILPKYTSATGGEVFPEFSKEAMEEAYARAMGDARNQYTLGYYTHAKPGAYRQLEVRVAHPGLKVAARDGYYPLPPPR